nr:iron ABC transporter permease [Paracidobacterium acidisoli]
MVTPLAEPKTGTAAPGRAGVRPALLLLLGIALVLAVLGSALAGSVHISLAEILGAVFRGRPLSTVDREILVSIRLPRIFAAVIAGSALSVSGLLFQGLFRNPLADPYVIGSSGGAVLGASVGIFLFPAVSVGGFSTITLLALAGSMTSITVVYAIARVNGRTPVVSLLLAGFAVSTMLSYSSYFLEALDQDFGVGSRVLASWLRGAISTPTWTQLVIAVILLATGLAGSLPLARRLNTLALGEEYASQLGLHIETVRILIILIGSILTAVAVSLGGLISFVGLIVPHVARLVLGPDHLRLLPVTALGGAIFLLIADTLARTILSPAEMPVGVLTAFVGGPFFLYLLRKTRQELQA